MTSGPGSRLTGAVLILVLLAAPPLAHVALLRQRDLGFAGALIAAQAVIITWIVSAQVSRRVVRVAGCVVVGLVALALSRFAAGGPVVASAVPHAMANLALLALFAASLEPGREALITVLARRSRGALPPDIIRYTRRLTWLWCGFFLAQVVVSGLLLAFAPLTLWSAFVNLCNLPLVLLLLAAEFAWRQWRHAADPPERLIDMVRIYRRLPSAAIPDKR